MSVPTIEAVDFGGNCGLWGKVHAVVGRGQSLSWPHSRSRDLPGGVGGRSGQAGDGCGSVWQQGH